MAESALELEEQYESKLGNVNATDISKKKMEKIVFISFHFNYEKRCYLNMLLKFSEVFSTSLVGPRPKSIEGWGD